MARECFEDAEVAQALNESFVSVKVDREERPDIDSVYMRACMAFTGSGGWPLSAFLTPDQRPFFAGTYFPKTGRGGMTGFLDLLDATGRRCSTRRTPFSAVFPALPPHPAPRPMRLPPLPVRRCSTRPRPIFPPPSTRNGAASAPRPSSLCPMF